MMPHLIAFHVIASHVPLALAFALIGGAALRAHAPRRTARVFGIAAVALLGGLTTWSYLAPVNLVSWMTLAALGLAAALAAALTAPKRMLLIEPLGFPICLITVVTVGTWR